MNIYKNTVNNIKITPQKLSTIVVKLAYFVGGVKGHGSLPVSFFVMTTSGFFFFVVTTSGSFFVLTTSGSFFVLTTSGSFFVVVIH